MARFRMRTGRQFHVADANLCRTADVAQPLTTDFVVRTFVPNFERDFGDVHGSLQGHPPFNTETCANQSQRWDSQVTPGTETRKDWSRQVRAGCTKSKRRAAGLSICRANRKQDRKVNVAQVN